MNAPTLIIGIGGAGGEILLELSKRTSFEEKKNIGFVVMDTDVNSLKKLRERGYSGEIIATSTNTTVGYALSKNTYARDNWFPINSVLNRKTLTEGAGQARAISRLAFDSLISSERIRPLYDSIEKLHQIKGEELKQSLRVMIVGSLAGGTGSGMLLYLGMHIRNYMKEYYSTDAVDIRGFFLSAEIFKSNIEEQKELMTLMANSYATLKELNAFFMKADNLLTKKYTSLIFDGLEYETKKIKEYNSLPYDFCFIYDYISMSNENLGQKSNYIVHAAKCIYALAISPINERSNSLEDNQIIPLVDSDGRNRYCGAGESELVFPITDIVEYLTLKLKNTHLSNQWLKYDKEYLKKKKEIKDNIEKGMYPVSLTKYESYIDTVNYYAKAKDAFSNKIRFENTYLKENGFANNDMKYDIYFNEIKNYAEICINDDPAWQKLNKSLNDEIDNLVNEPEIIEETSLKGIQKKIYKITVNMKNYLLDSYKRYTDLTAINFFLNTTNGSQKYHLNYWLQDNMQPNSVRYFLYSLKQKIMAEDEKLKSNVSKKKQEDFINYEKEGWKRNDATNTAIGIDQYLKENNIVHHRYLLKSKINHKNRDEFIEKIKDFILNSNEYRKNIMLLSFLEECLKHVNVLCDRLEQFYQNLEDSVNKLPYEFEKYENRYSDKPMGTTRYICCDKECLEYFGKQIDDYSTYYEIPEELSKTIINSIINMDKNDNNIQKLNDIYETEIPKFYRKYINENHSSITNMTILDALELEIKIKSNFTVSRDNIKKRVNEIIEEGYRLSAPFICCEHDAKNRTVVACTFNSKLFKDIKRKEFEYIYNKLENYNKIEDENYTMNNIMFYRAIYGLKADELTRFQPLEATPTYLKDYGLYYRAYKSVIKNIKTGTGKKYYNNKTITPHVHYNWHLITKMPELSATNQKKIEQKICDALVCGILTGKIEYKKNNDSTYSYVFNGNKQLITSFNTKSESFYELIDALACDVRLQDSIIYEIKNNIKEDKSHHVSFEKCRIIEKIKDLNINKRDIEGNDELDKISLFTLGILYYITCPYNLYNVEWLDYLIKSVISLLNYLIITFIDISKRDEVIIKIFKDQCDKFKKDYEKLSKIDNYDYLAINNDIKNILRDNLRIYLEKSLILKEQNKINNLIGMINF